MFILYEAFMIRISQCHHLSLSAPITHHPSLITHHCYHPSPDTRHSHYLSLTTCHSPPITHHLSTHHLSLTICHSPPVHSPPISLTTRPAKSTGLPSRLLFFLTPSTDLLGGRTFLLVLKKLNFWYLIFFPDFYLFFVWIHF